MKVKKQKANQKPLSLYTILLTASVAFMFILTLSLKSEAQENSVNTSSPQGASQIKVEDAKQEAPSKKFSIFGQIEGSANLREQSDYESSRGASYMLSPSYQITDRLKLSAVAVFVNDLKEVRNSDFGNTEISLSYGAIELVPEQLNITPALTGVLATNTAARETTSLQGGIGVKQSLAFDMKKLKLPVVLSYGTLLRKNIHEYTYTNTGSSNTSYSINNSLGANIDLGKQISFGTRGVLLSGLTYNNTWRSKFEIGEEIGYQINNNFSVALGHVNSDSTLKSNMNDSNVEVFNSNTSSIYVDLNVTY